MISYMDTKRTEKLYFARCSGQVVVLKAVYHKGGDRTPQYYRGTCPVCSKKHTPERIIVRPLEASNHVCDERCIHATGQRCECKCGGENHGIGGLGITSIGVV